MLTHSPHRTSGRWLAGCAAAAGLLAVLAGCPPEGSKLPVTITDAASSAPVAPPAPPVYIPPADGNAGGPRIGLPPGPLDAGPSVQTRPIIPVFSEQQQAIRLVGGRNEVLTFQLDFAPSEGRLQGLRFLVSDIELAGPRKLGERPPRIDRSDIRLFRIVPVPVKELPGWYQLYGPGGRDAANLASGEFPDALVPVDHPRLGEPFNVSAGDRLSIWADVTVRPNVEPGLYEGRLMLLTANFPPRQVDISVQVMPWELTAQSALSFVAPIDFKAMLAAELDRPELTDSLVYAPGRLNQLARKRMGQWIGVGRAHGVQFTPADLAPIVKRDLDGRLDVDWSGYDRLVELYLSVEDRPPFWLAPFRLDFPDPALYGGVDSPAYGDLADKYLRQIGTHFTQRRWPTPIVWVHRDQPEQVTLPYGARHWKDYMTPRRRSESLRIGRLVRLTEMQIGYLETLPWSAMRPGEGVLGLQTDRAWVAGVPPHVSIYCPPAQFLRPETIAALGARGMFTWLGEGEPPWRPATDVFASAEQLEAFAPLARRYGLNTIWLGPTMRWPARSPLASPADADQARFLFYPGHWFDQDLPVASLRVKYLRQARQDFGYLLMLQDAGRALAADGLARALVKYALAPAESELPGLGRPVGWVTEPAYYSDARMLLRQEMELAEREKASPQGEPAGPTDAMAQQVRTRWLEFMDRTAWIRLDLLPGQLADRFDAAGAPNGRLAAFVRATAYADPVALSSMIPGVPVGSGRPPVLLFGELPDSWRATRHNVPLEPTTAPAPAPRLTLSAEGEKLPIDRGGRVLMPLVLRSGESVELARLGANVPVLAAHRFARPPKLDGKLDDWPAAGWFRGAGFHRMHPARPLRLDAPEPIPPADTAIFAGYDDDRLYLAAACLGEKLADIRFKASNDVTLDHGLVVGEDAIEVVLDPTGGRLGRDQLYRLIVKANGDVIGWRGLAGPDGTGPPPAWGQGSVRAHVGYREDGWLVELAISRRALLEQDPYGLWRINVARHLAVRGEHSAWACGHPVLCEPAALGNLMLRPPPLPEVEIELTPPSPLYETPGLR